HRTPQPEWRRFSHTSLLKPSSSDKKMTRTSRRQARSKGHTNLIDHLNRRHSSQVVAQAYEDHIDGIRRQSPFVDVSPEALNIFRWVGRSREPRAAILRERIGEKEHKLGSSVEQDVAGLEISSHVRDAIATAIAGSVVQLVPDAWTDGNWHYLGIMAVVPDPRDGARQSSRLLRTPKKRNVLRQSDIIIPCLQNETRWSSTLEILRTHASIQPRLDVDDDDIVKRLLSPAENLAMKKLLEELMDFESVSKVLQNSVYGCLG
ncbi:TPA: LOW QUALITY PROTEIN: hypothetical protein N0F65_004383, partial [Lagenidium giganteum]